MIPLRVVRLLAVLLTVSAILALLDAGLGALGLSRPATHVLEGVAAGAVVFVLVYFSGWVLLFCGKGISGADAERRAKIRAALRDLGVIEERRKPRLWARASDGSGAPHRRAARPAREPLMYVSVVDSQRFIAITVNSGRMHRAFVSTRLVDALSAEALRGVVAHEYGHVEHRHPMKQASILGLVATVKMTVGIPVGAAIVLLLAYLFMLREWEYAADAAAIKRTASADVLQAFQEYLELEGVKKMSRVSEFFCGHPCTYRRIDAIKQLELSPDGGAS